MLCGSVWLQLVSIYEERREVGPQSSTPSVLASSWKTRVMSYSTRIPMAVLPARSFILRVSYPTLVSTSIPSNRSLLLALEPLAMLRTLRRAELFRISLGFTLLLVLSFLGVEGTDGRRE